MVSTDTRKTVIVRRAASSVLRQVANASKEAGNRILSAPGVAGDVLGMHRPLKLRLRVVILRDEQGNLLADPNDVLPSIEDAQEIFWRDARIQIQPFEDVFIRQAPSAAPSEALDVSCGAGAWQQDLGVAGDYFRQHSARDRRSRATGYASPLTVFITRSMQRANGCALGPIADYATVSLPGLASRDDPCITNSPRTAHRVLAHELGHMCGLLHSKDCQDLMFTSAGWKLTTKRQVLNIRSSRFVTPL